MSPTQYERMRQRLLKGINEKEDSLRIYKLPESRQRVLEEYGVNDVKDFEGPLVV